MELKKIVVFDTNIPRSPFLQEDKRTLQETLPDCTFYYGHSGREILDQTGDADAAILWGVRDPDVLTFIKGARSLKWLILMTTGYDHVVKPGLPRLDSLIVTRTSGGKIHSVPMSEHILAMMLSLLRQFPRMQDMTRSRQWPGTLLPACEGASGKAVGIIGLGNIGRETARKCKAFDMRVYCAQRHRPDDPNVDEYFPMNRLNEMLAASDFVVVCCLLCEDTYHLIGREEVAAMKVGARLINVGRGPIVDTDALIAGIQSGRIAGAGLDVFDQEPLPKDSPLYAFPNVIITPHAAAQTPHYVSDAVEIICRNFVNLRAGRPLENVVHWPV